MTAIEFLTLAVGLFVGVCVFGAVLLWGLFLIERWSEK